jgi:hypothetical protein
MDETFSKTQDQSTENTYQKLIMDTYISVKFLNSLELGLQEEVLSIFRKNLFEKDTQSPKLIEEVMMKEYRKTRGSLDTSRNLTVNLVDSYKGDVASAS